MDVRVIVGPGICDGDGLWGWGLGVKQESGGNSLSPFAPSWAIDGVTSVFKRFFEPYCEMQILFDDGFGKKAFDAFEHAEQTMYSNAQNSTKTF